MEAASETENELTAVKPTISEKKMATTKMAKMAKMVSALEYVIMSQRNTAAFGIYPNMDSLVFS